MQQYHYRSTDPAVVAIVQDCFNQRQALRLAADRLGEAFGGEVALLRTMNDVMPGGSELCRGGSSDAVAGSGDHDGAHRCSPRCLWPMRGGPR